MRALLLVLLALTCFAAAPKPVPASDATVEAAIRAKLAKSKISSNNFRVSVKSGVAILEGRTDIPQHKGVATRLAKSGGAREVVNRIQIGEAARKKLADRLEKARQNHKDPGPIAKTETPEKAPETPRRLQIKH